MGNILDIAAGILLALGIRAFTLHWFQVSEEDRRGGERNAVATALGWLGVAIGVALVVCRLARWP